MPIRLLVVSALAVAAGYAGAFLPGGTPGWAPWLFLIGVSTMLLGMMLLGARPRGASRAPIGIALALLYVLLAGGFGLALALPAESAESPRLVLGLPLRTALVLYGIGLLPCVILPVVYARTFDTLTLREEDLARIAALRARREASS